MGYISFDLTDCGSLHTMASPAAGQPGTLPANLPNTGGLYLIVNQNNQNRYIGKAGDLSNRFTERMLTVNELGQSQQDLTGIIAFWGEATVYSTPALAPGAFAPANTPLTNGFRIARNANGPAPVVPNQFIGVQSAAPTYGNPAVTTTIDGVQINVEALLIRFFRQIGVGGTITNLHHTGFFQNPTPNELIVQCEWGACGQIPAAHFCITIPGNGVF